MSKQCYRSRRQTKKIKNAKKHKEKFQKNKYFNLIIKDYLKYS